MKQIAELINRRPLVHAAPTETVRDAARRMSEKNVGAVAVLDGGKLVGIFSERDVLNRVVAKGLDPDKTRVGEVMTKELVVASTNEDAEDALQKMFSRRCRHLPVVEEGNLVGMISLRDLFQVEEEMIKEKASFLKELVTYSPDYES